jgi:hypothetical protein
MKSSQRPEGSVKTFETRRNGGSRGIIGIGLGNSSVPPTPSFTWVQAKYLAVRNSVLLKNPETRKKGGNREVDGQLKPTPVPPFLRVSKVLVYGCR